MESSAKAKLSGSWVAKPLELTVRDDCHHAGSLYLPKPVITCTQAHLDARLIKKAQQFGRSD